MVRQAWIFDCISATKRLANQGSNVQWRQELTNYKLPRYSIATIRKVRTEFTEKEIECLAAMLLRVGKPRGFKYEAEAARAAHNKVSSRIARVCEISIRNRGPTDGDLTRVRTAFPVSRKSFRSILVEPIVETFLTNRS